MAVRTTEQNISFRHPFKLDAFEAIQPAGAYKIVIDEEEILGLSFLAYRRVATMLHAPAISVTGAQRQVYAIDAADLEAALEADRRDRSNI